MSASSHGDDRKPRYTEAEAAELLRATFPDIGSPALRFCGQGSDFCSYAVDESRILRIGVDDESALRLNWERQLLPILAQKLDIASPAFQHVGQTRDGAPFVVYPMIHGEPFDEDIYERLSPESRDVIADQFAAYLRVLHGFSVEKAYEYGIRERRADDVCREFRDKAKGMIYPDLSASELATCEGLFDRYFGEGYDAYAPALIHGDLQPRHGSRASSTTATSGSAIPTTTCTTCTDNTATTYSTVSCRAMNTTRPTPADGSPACSACAVAWTRSSSARRTSVPTMSRTDGAICASSWPRHRLTRHRRQDGTPSQSRHMSSQGGSSCVSSRSILRKSYSAACRIWRE